MDLRQLEYFVAVTEQGSFSRAAASLNLAQPSVSRQVALLEEELGQRLLERTGRGVTPTPAGHALLAHARVMLNAASQALSDLKEMHAEPVGRVVVGLPNRVAMGLSVALMKEFRQRFPNALLSIVEGLSLSLREGMIAGRIDLGLLFDPAPTPLLSYEQLMRERMMLVAPKAYRLTEQVALSTLANFPLVLPGSHNPIRTLVDAVLLPRRIVLNVVAEVGAVHTALTVVEEGLACSILPDSALHLSRRPDEIQAAPIGPPAIRNQLVLAIPRARPATRLVAETAKLLRELDFRNGGGAGH
ncbi:LysR family transcriptional regulator [Acidovorax kalamii]|uniref:LysR family transcriptional regulator n=1 Tax=Acidovorax kalamii TaxID=2004485 RepID=A0A235EGH3_9BURK|nr:LysR substrate-binding domain-containing protein [Acidovorax kalamii]OYD48124.1 LysR family transcriptional regulator [Acidovorax kalamii]